MHVDEMIACADCGKQFAFTMGEQRFYETKGFANKPTRCPDCRIARKAMRSNGAPMPATGGEAPRPRETFSATCSNCGGVAELPFRPRGDKPVFCRDCFGSKPTFR